MHKAILLLVQLDITLSFDVYLRTLKSKDTKCERFALNQIIINVIRNKVNCTPLVSCCIILHLMHVLVSFVKEGSSVFILRCRRQIRTLSQVACSTYLVNPRSTSKDQYQIKGKYCQSSSLQITMNSFKILYFPTNCTRISRTC